MYFKTVSCMKCGREAQEKDIFTGCPHCSDNEKRYNFVTEYQFDDKAKDVFLGCTGQGLWKYKPFLPINKETNPISIGEGGTPLHHCTRLGKKLGLNNLYIKNEGQNPTWSHKDRLCSVAMTKAVEQGAKVVTVSSTGNHGASVAAYAAAAGLPCVVFTVNSGPYVLKTLMQAYGAYVVAMPSLMDRWTIMEWCVKNLGWYPMSSFIAPPTGSICYGIDGYKTIAYELFEQLGDLPDFIVMPSAYSDGLSGIWKGVKDLNAIGLTKRKSRMISSEVAGSIKETLRQNKDYPVTMQKLSSVSFSIGNATGTYQGYLAVKESNGYAETANDEETIAMQLELGRLEGIYAEAASVTSLVAIDKLVKAGKIDPDQRIVAIITSSGLKDPDITAKQMPQVPTIEPNYTELKKVLKEVYGAAL